MTTTLTSCLVTGSAILATVDAVKAESNFLDIPASSVSAVSIMAIFLWRETKKNEKLEKELAEERKSRMDSDKKCSECQFVREANEQFLKDKKEQK